MRLPFYSGGRDEWSPSSSQTGDKNLIGFPISYKTTYSEPDNKESKPTVISMDVTDGIGGSDVDRTAGAAMYVMQQAMNGASAGVSQDGPSFDAALNEAIQDAGKEAVEAVKKAPSKK